MEPEQQQEKIEELQKILDDTEADDDDFVGQRVGVRGELSLEHTFRQLSLVLDALEANELDRTRRPAIVLENIIKAEVMYQRSLDELLRDYQKSTLGD